MIEILSDFFDTKLGSIIVIIISAIAGAVTYAITELLLRKKDPPPDDGIDFSNKSGMWYGIHFTRSPSDDNNKLVLSTHVYDLTVTKDGNISGGLVDKISGEEGKDRKCIIKGHINKDRMRLEDITVRTNLYKLEVYYEGLDTNVFKGFIIGKGFDGEYFETRIVIFQGDRNPILDTLYKWLIKEQPHRHFCEEVSMENIRKTLGLSDSQSEQE